MDSNNDTFYFLAFYAGDREKITVIDLGYSVDYQRSDWANVNDETFYDHKTAIEEAKRIAVEKNIEYMPFKSRYNSELNESDIEAIFPKAPVGTIELHPIKSAPLDTMILLYWADTGHYENGKVFIEDDVLFHGLTDGECLADNPSHWSAAPTFILKGE